MKTEIKRYGNGLAHLKCIICDYEVYQDSVWYIKNYNEDTDGWFTCPICRNESLSVIEDYNKFKLIFK